MLSKFFGKGNKRKSNQDEKEGNKNLESRILLKGMFGFWKSIKEKKYTKKNYFIILLIFFIF